MLYRTHAVFIALGSVVAAQAAVPSLTATSTYTCTNISPPKYYCPVKGTLSRPNVVGLENDLRSLSACRDVCLSNNVCVTFSWNNVNQQCIQYGDTIVNMGLKARANEPGLLFNKACFSCTQSGPPTCQNAGVQYAIFASPFERNTDATYSAFDPSYFQTATPEHQNTALFVGGNVDDTDTTASIYGDPYTFASTYFAVNHRGYIYVPVAGTYTFNTGINGSAIDDILFLWTGSNAVTGYTRDNALVVASFNTGYGITTTTFEATPGYLPFRALFGQGDGGAGLTMTVTDPSGNYILTSTLSSSQLGNFVVQTGCNGETNAEAFSAWGNEAAVL